MTFSDITLPPSELLQEVAAELSRAALVAQDRRAINALNKASYYLTLGISSRLRFSAGDLLIPSATTAGQVYRVSGAGCSCEAALHGKDCWHGALVEVVLVARQRWDEARDNGEPMDAADVDDEPFLPARPAWMDAADALYA